jgi:hypothetical protein
MQITKQGKQAVASLDFAQEIGNLLAELRADGVPDELGIAVTVCLIGWVLTGHCINCLPKTDEEWTALAIFCDSHAAEIDEVGGACLAVVCQNDYVQ